MRKRITPNPLADKHEQRHGPMLDEIHRLVSGLCGGCVTMPVGVEFDHGKVRRATDDECSCGEIFISNGLPFYVNGDTVAESAALQLEGFGHELLETADAIRKAGKRMERTPKRKGGGA